MNQINKDSLIKFKDLLDDIEEKVQGIFVMTSKKSNKDYTYKIIGKTKNGIRVLSVCIETDYNTFKPIYYINNGKLYNKSFTDENKSGAVWFLQNIFHSNFDKILNNYTLQHTGKCIKCNRTLTDAESIEFGMGKTCRGNKYKHYNRES